MGDTTPTKSQQADSTISDLLDEFPRVSEMISQSSSSLLMLPTEILEHIVADQDLDSKDLRALAHSSRHLFYQARARLYKAALANGDLEALTRWYESGGFPDIFLIHNSRNFGKYDEGDFYFNKGRTPNHPESFMGSVFLLLDCHSTGRLTYQRCLDVLLWFQDHLDEFKELYGLVDGQYTTIYRHEERTQPFKDSVLVSPIIDAMLDWFREDRPREAMESICRMIGVLTKRGAKLPKYGILIHGRKTNGEDFHDIFFRLNVASPSLYSDYIGPLQIAMSPQCPPSLLETVLKAFRAEGLCVRSLSKFQELSLLKTGGSDFDPKRQYELTNLWELFSKIFNILFFGTDYFFYDPELDRWMAICIDGKHKSVLWGSECKEQHWDEEHVRNVVDMLAMKVELLVEYEAITEHERELLQFQLDCVRLLFSIVDQSEGGLDRARHARLCWHILFGPENYPHDDLTDAEAEEFFKHLAEAMQYPEESDFPVAAGPWMGKAADVPGALALAPRWLEFWRGAHPDEFDDYLPFYFW